jgi:DNA-binding CsgD family transcriptional regulator
VLGIGGGLNLARRAGTVGPPPSPYRLSATPIRLDGPPPLPGAPAVPARVLLLVSDPDRRATKLNLTAFAQACHISAAELRVLELLLQGMAPKAIAEHLNLGVRTVRSQLSSLYAKTGTRGQRELVALTLRLGREGT